MFDRLLRITDVSAHCDLPCGVYDPAQARIEAESIKAVCKKVADRFFRCESGSHGPFRGRLHKPSTFCYEFACIFECHDARNRRSGYLAKAVACHGGGANPP